MNVGTRGALACLLLVAGQVSSRAAPAETESPAALDSLAAEVAGAVAAHRALYLGEKKTPEQASKLPAVLWHVGEPMTRGGDVAMLFEPASGLGHDRDAAKLQALADAVETLRPKAEALVLKAHEAAESARKLAARVAPMTVEQVVVAGAARPPEPEAPATESEPALLAWLALKALGSATPKPARAAACLEELAGRLDHLADLDRWLALNCRWLVETNAWTKTPGMAPRSLCYSIQARFNEAAAVQSRVEDVLFATDGERAVWRRLVLPDAGDKVAPEPDKAQPKARRAEGPPSLDQLQRRIDALRKVDVEIDRKVAALTHDRKLAEARRMRLKEYLPVVVELEYLQREAAVRRRAGGGKPGDLLVAEADARPLSLSSRSALARVASALTDAQRRRLKPVLADMLRREYLASYADLCLYQSAMLATEPHLAARLGRWLDLTPRPGVRGLMEMMHATPGVMTTAQRSDNAYQPEIMAWAAGCRGKDRAARFREARALTHAFYRKSGYNQNRPVYTMRDVLESGLVDCLAACRIQGAVAAAAGVEGLVPVRYWKQKLGHTLIGLRTGNGVVVMDPLGGPAERPYPGGYPNVVTIETGAPSFGSYVVHDITIIGTGRRLTRTPPYLEAPGGGSQ